MAVNTSKKVTKEFTVITLFPSLIEQFAKTGIIGKACTDEKVSIRTLNPRDFSNNSGKSVDDSPYGGGPGMVMKVKPLRAAIRHARRSADRDSHVVFLSPQGRPFDNESLSHFDRYSRIVFVAGRYEGVDERILVRDIDSEWSVGDFVVTGGEVPAMIIMDAVIRRLPGVVGAPRSLTEDSFAADGLLDFPHYTRPRNIDGQEVPKVLLEGNHSEIAMWRRRQQLERTFRRRPDLIPKARLSKEDRNFLALLGYECK